MFWAKSLRRLVFYRLAISCQQVAASLLTSSSCSKSVKIRLVATWYLKTCCKLLKQLVSSLWIKCWQSTCSKPVENLQKTCYHQAGASDANASWYRPDDSKVRSLQHRDFSKHFFYIFFVKNEFLRKERNFQAAFWHKYSWIHSWIHPWYIYVAKTLKLINYDNTSWTHYRLHCRFMKYRGPDHIIWEAMLVAMCCSVFTH